MKRPLKIGLLLIPVLLIGGVSLWFTRPATVTVIKPHRGEAVELIYATGFVEPVQPISVMSRLTAPVVAVGAAEGEEVRRGQALVRLDDTDLRNSLAEARAQSRNATLAEGRARTLFTQGWATKANRDAAAAAGESARAAERTAAARLDQYVIRAGIDGVVIKRDVEPGDLAAPSRVLMQLGDPRRIWVTATVDERDIPRVRIGQQALLSSDAWPNRIVHSHVIRLTPTGNPNERAFRARLAIDDTVSLPMGMSLEVNIVSRRIARALLIPASAIANGDAWTIDDGRARKRSVRTGIAGTEQVQILSGLREGDRVIDRPPASLREGDRVRAAVR